MRSHDVVPRPAQRIEDHDGSTFCRRVLHALGDIAERIAQDLAGLEGCCLCVTDLALVADVPALTVVVVIHRFKRLLPERVQFFLRIVRVAQCVINGGKFFGIDKSVGRGHHRRPKVAHGGDDVGPG